MYRKNRRVGARSSRADAAHLHPGEAEGAPVGHRPHRLESILLEQLQSLLRDEAADPALGGVRLVSLRLSVDGGHARVAYAVEARLGDAAGAERATREALARACGFLRWRLADLLDLKRLPTLTFTFVGVQEHAAAAPEAEGGEPWLA
jgi:ribosome-binding factor A